MAFWVLSAAAHKTSALPARINLARGEREGERERKGRGTEGREGREMRLFVSRLFQYYSVINSERTRPGLNRRKLQMPGSERRGEGEKSAGKLHRSRATVCSRILRVFRCCVSKLSPGGGIMGFGFHAVCRRSF